MLWHASHELMDAIPILDAWEMLSGVCVLQHVVIIRLDAFFLDPTLDLFVLFTCRKHVVGINV
jgi:hypothetical protein